jgi:hypothetical protein
MSATCAPVQFVGHVFVGNSRHESKHYEMLDSRQLPYALQSQVEVLTLLKATFWIERGNVDRLVSNIVDTA